jgi:hypothetical protein
MKFRSPPIFKTTFHPLEAAILILYLREASRREKSSYLSGFLDYVANMVLLHFVELNHISPTQREHALEHAEAILADIRQNGEPCFWINPATEEN